MTIHRKINWKTLRMVTIAILLTGCRHAQDISGDWQGTLSVSQSTPLRIVIEISRGENGV